MTMQLLEQRHLDALDKATDGIVSEIMAGQMLLTDALADVVTRSSTDDMQLIRAVQQDIIEKVRNRLTRTRA